MTLFCDAPEFRLESAQCIRLGILRRPYPGTQAATLDSGIQAVLADLKPGSNFGDRLPLPNSFNLEFFRNPVCLFFKAWSTS